MASGVSYLPIKTRVNGPVSYQTFLEKLKKHYNRGDNLPVELALIALSRDDDSWNERLYKIKTGEISVPEQIKLENRVQLQQKDLLETGHTSIEVSERVSIGSIQQRTQIGKVSVCFAFIFAGLIITRAMGIAFECVCKKV